MWKKVVAEKMPHLSKPQAVVLALWSYGMVMARSSGLTSVTAILSSLLGEKENNLRQRLREWCWDKGDKAGQRRTDWAVQDSFLALIYWIVSWWKAGEKWLVIAMDATTLGQRFVVLAISIVYRGCAIPIAWAILPACQKAAWKEHWIEMFGILEKSLPKDWIVLVLADRGLYADWLWKAIQRAGWHPFLRINLGGKYRQKDSSQFFPLSQTVLSNGDVWSEEVVCFKNHPIQATLLTWWDARYQDPWVIVTDFSSTQAKISWYGMRSWIECGFKQIKRAGWQWQNTRMIDAQRASRLWLAIAVATLWVVSVGGEADAACPSSSLDLLPGDAELLVKPSKPSKPRLISCFRRGILIILTALLNHKPLPLGGFFPDFPLYHPKTYP